LVFILYGPAKTWEGKIRRRKEKRGKSNPPNYLFCFWEFGMLFLLFSLSLPSSFLALAGSLLFSIFLFGENKEPAPKPRRKEEE